MPKNLDFKPKMDCFYLTFLHKNVINNIDVARRYIIVVYI